MHDRGYTLLLRIAILLMVVMLLVSVTACIGSRAPAATATIAQTASARPETIRSKITFKDAGLEFDAVIDAPPEAGRSGWGVLLIGGGMGNDLDWTTPGSITVDGQVTPMTISGRGHADAPTLSTALIQRGFVVLRWSTIARDDPLADQWPVRATPRTLTDLVRQAKAALEALRSSGLIERDRVILVGHSLGAARACTLAREDAGVRALVLLAPAYFTRDEAIPRTFIESGMAHGEDVLNSRPIPCLALFGSLDASRSVNSSAALEFAKRPGLTHLSVSVLNGLGHQLGPHENKRIGPIDPAAIQHVADWAKAATRNE